MFDKIKATLPTTNHENGRNWGDSKETVRDLTLTVFSAAERKRTRKAYPAQASPGDGFTTPVTVRWYMGRSAQASTVYCSIWVSVKGGGYHAGTGSAGGGGYHKESAALQSAIDSAGIKLDHAIDGVGDSAIRMAVDAIGCACGYSRLPRVQA